jgi:hypothetical protein
MLVSLEMLTTTFIAQKINFKATHLSHVLYFHEVGHALEVDALAEEN